MGLSLAAFHISSSPAPRRIVVLITDGENNAGAVNPETAAALVRNQASSLWVIGVGSSGEIPIDYLDPRTHIRRSGTFDSRYNIESLRAITEAGEGTLITAPTSESFLEAFSELNAAEMTVLRSGTINKKESFHTAAIIFSLMLILMSRIIKRTILGAHV
jgi:Ca-activated chloride channel family protein